jgi:predicted O-methyltransferase YrrM
VRVHNPPGHFFSPVVDPDEIGDYYRMSASAEPHDLAGIDFHLDDMVAFWTRNRDFIAATPFTSEPDGKHRYHYRGPPFPEGDAITLRAMIGHFRPRRIIEIGSGFSTGCMLDSAEHAGLDTVRLDCIDPYPQRLRSLLRPGDLARVRIHERGVQGMPLDMFRELEAGDILFIDSTHVLKTGSDVHYELFYILPVLKPGVLIHWHDCRFPFEYSTEMVFRKNYSWNEVYAVRLLLMDSRRYRMVFWGSLFARVHEELIARTIPIYLRKPGSALWAQVQG